MGFAPATISFANQTTTIFHDTINICRFIPWTITSVYCPVSRRNLNKYAWAIESYTPTATGMSATLRLLALNPANPLDVELQGDFYLQPQVQLKFTLRMSDPNQRPQTLYVTLTP